MKAAKVVQTEGERMKPEGRLTPFAGPIQLEKTATDLFLVLDGERIAQRGRPNTPQAGTWVSLNVPGLEFSDSGREGVEVKRYGQRLN